MDKPCSGRRSSFALNVIPDPANIVVNSRINGIPIVVSRDLKGQRLIL